MKEAVNKFREEWLNRCKEIKKESFSKNQCAVLRLTYEKESMLLTMSFPPGSMTWETLRLLESLDSELELALTTAESNYEKTKKSFLSKFFGELKIIIFSFFGK